MSPEEPFPPALPAVVPSPIGPAISYSNIRAVTSRAERTLDGLGKKVSKRLQGQMNDSGMVGAVVESKVRQRLADQLAPAEQLYSDYTDLIQNQIAGNLAPAVATLEDLGAATGESQRVATTTEMAGHGMPGVEAALPPVATPLAPSPPLRAGGLRRQLERSAASVVGGPLISPFAGKCDNIPPTVVGKAAFNALTVDTSPAMTLHHVGNLWNFFVTPDCCLTNHINDPNDPVLKCSTSIFIGSGDQVYVDAISASIIATLADNGINVTNQCNAVCPPSTPVDCTKTPLDPACPPDCKTHPEDPRCPPTPPTCPPPCIDVTCPPPIINVPPCPSLTPTSCVQIDLCDYDKFCKFIKDCLIQAKQDCALDNEAAYLYKDCDGTFGDALKGLLGSLDGGSLAANDMEDLASNSLAGIAALDSTQFPTLFRV